MQNWWIGLKEAYYVGQNYDEDRWWFKWYCVLYYIVGANWWLRQFCKMFGHKIEADSCITPDSGVEYFHCTRCGWSDKIIYY